MCYGVLCVLCCALCVVLCCDVMCCVVLFVLCCVVLCCAAPKRVLNLINAGTRKRGG